MRRWAGQLQRWFECRVLLVREAIAHWLWHWAVDGVARKRRPDFTIGNPADPYLLRWWLIPRNRFFNLYLHAILRSDDDRALHDHPWHFASMILIGSYTEHALDRNGYPIKNRYRAGDTLFRRASYPHRLELDPDVGAWTLVVTSPRVRQWGFLCNRGWVHWKEFTDPATDGATVGRGCGEHDLPTRKTP
jgi:hypothetical protein